MEVQFYYSASDSRVINKNIIEGETFYGQARDEVDVMTPTIIFETPDIFKYNYAYIPEFERYYEILTRSSYREGLWEITLKVDVLMSFRGDILQLPVVVDKQTLKENGNEYIDDSSLVAENVMFQTVYNFPEGFNDSPEFILITAG